MRLLFSCVPSAGHLLPLLGLAEAAREDGHAVAVTTHPEMEPHVGVLELLPRDGSIAEGMAEVERRGFPSPAQPGPGAVEMFAGVLVDLGLADALAHARAFTPDLVVGDHFDFVGRLAADSLGVPWVSHEISGGVPAELDAALAARAARQYVERGLEPTERIALIDPYPELLRAGESGWSPAPDRIPMRPLTHRADGPPLPRGDRPTALVTFGTTVDDRRALVAAVASTLDAGLDVIVTAPPQALGADVDRTRVQAVGFVGLAALLPAADAVVSVGGTGTVLATLAAGLPLVIRPSHADHPFNAARVVRCGLGVTVDDFAQAGPAVRVALQDAAMGTRLREASAQIAALEPPEAVLERLLARVPA